MNCVVVDVSNRVSDPYFEQKVHGVFDQDAHDDSESKEDEEIDHEAIKKAKKRVARNKLQRLSR